MLSPPPPPDAVYGWLDGANFTGSESRDPYNLRVGFMKGAAFVSSRTLAYTVDVTEGTAGKKTHLKLIIIQCVVQLKFISLFCYSYIHRGG